MTTQATTYPDMPAVERASDAELDAAAQRAIRSTGLSIDELRDEARAGHFSSDQARMTWFAVSPIADRL